MKNTMKEQLINEMSQDERFKFVQIYTSYYPVPLSSTLVATMYDAQNVIDYVEFLEQKNAEDIKAGSFQISLHIAKAETAIKYSKLEEFVEYNGQAFGVVHYIGEAGPYKDEVIEHRLVGKNDSYKFFEVTSRFGDKSFTYNVAEKRDPMFVEIEKAPGKKFSELSNGLQKWFYEDGDVFDINKSTGECSVDFWPGELIVKASLAEDGNFKISPDAIIRLDEK